jgi:hypothetical protein
MIATPGERNRLMQKLRAETCVRRKNGICARANGRSPLFYKEGGSLWGLRRVGDRRAARTHVSCLPSSNRTCGFPASGSPIIFVRRLAPQSFQMAHFAHHSVQPTSFMKKAISPSFLGSPPAALMLTSEP